jgi:hypothetical protein
MWFTLLRGAGRYGTAQDLALSAADALPLSGRGSSAVHLSLYGILLCNAGYAAAQTATATAAPNCSTRQPGQPIC